EVIPLDEAFGNPANGVAPLEHDRQELWRLPEPFGHLAGEHGVDEASAETQLEREPCDRYQLGREGLRRGDTNLDARAGVDYAIGRPRQRAADHITDRDRARTMVPGLAQRGEDIGRLPGLGDCHREDTAVDDRSAIAEF